jgi:hypothetical protein
MMRVDVAGIALATTFVYAISCSMIYLALFKLKRS